MPRKMKHPFLLSVTLACSMLSAPLLAADDDERVMPALIPLPASLSLEEGAFTLRDGMSIRSDPAGRDAALQLERSLLERTGLDLEIVESPDGPGEGPAITLRIDESRDTADGEGYSLRSSRRGIVIEAGTPAGLFYGAQTLRQLLREEGGSRRAWSVPCCTIDDEPRFAWRGLMLDCSRTFQSLDYIRKTIDRISFYKMNVLHLHLTDDQGWRIEIKKFPELTKKGARFPARWDEPESHQGFYTQEQMIELVEYARQRNVTIVPEIEMPGHTVAVLACYPGLSCTGGPFEIHPFFKGPGIHEEIFCAGNEATFEFLEDVLTEVFDIFPSHFIHIGGDEAPKSCWQACGKCQARMEREGLRSEHELQSYFIKRIEKFVNANGRSIIGWDEILEGGLAPNAAVMSWRGVAGGIAAARSDHDVVMSPTSHCYFDYTYGRIDARRAYSFEPVPGELDESQAKRVLGLQANFWSHIDREPDRVDWQLFPRLLAVAERGWSQASVRSWPDFEQRLDAHTVFLDQMGVHYRPAPAGRWSRDEMSETYKELEWDVTRFIRGPGRYRIRLAYTHGAHRLGIESVALVAGSRTISTDSHRGVTGARHERNDYTVRLDSGQEADRYAIRASVRSEGGTDSFGEVFVIKLHDAREAVESKDGK